MPPKKEIKWNGYSVFIEETYKSHGMPRKDAFSALTHLWSKFSVEEKNAYNEKAKQKNKNRSRMTASGVSYEELEQKERAEQRKRESMLNWIDRKVNGPDGRKPLALLAHTRFHVVHINKHTVTHDGKVVPAEMGLVRFSLKFGVEDARVFVIRNARKDLPPGYAYKMMQRALDTHCIPVEESFPLAKSPNEVVSRLKEFLCKEDNDQSHNYDTKVLPPFFVLKSKVERVDHTIEDEFKDAENVLQALFEKSNEIIAPPCVYDLNELFCSMWRAWVRRGGHSTIPDTLIKTTLQTKLEEDMYLYDTCSPDCCSFHAALENITDQYVAAYCSLCICKRYIYTICGYLTDKISKGIDCIPGIHKPTPRNGVPRRLPKEDGDLKLALKMAVLKEFKNPISGVEVPRGGSMNGTTLFLPKDKDPAVEIKDQMRKFELLQIDEDKQDSRKDVTSSDVSDSTSGDSTGSIIPEDVVNSDEDCLESQETSTPRIWARIDQRSSNEGNYDCQKSASATTFYSYTN